MMNSLEMNSIEEIKTLNPYQQEAVLDESPACLVNANVGSGKTTVLIEKVRHLHEKKQVSYKKMAVLTFTNKAADEIAERLSRKEAELTEEELWGFGTFHSVALRILRRFLPEKAEDGTKLEEWNREFTVITPEDEMEMVLAIAKEGGYKIKYQNRLKKRMEEDYAAYRKGRTQGKYKDDLFQIFPLLEKAKRQQNKMSFADLLEEGTQVAKEQEEVLDLKWIIVDEVQDSDEKQLKLVLAVVYGLLPKPAALATAFISAASAFGFLWIVEPISYFTVLGPIGTYMAFMSGNISNMRVPCAGMAQVAADVEPGTEKGSIISVIGMATSIVINVSVLTIGVILGSSVLSAMPASVTEALNYLLPALFGALLMQFGLKRIKFAGGMLAFAILIGIAINAGLFNWLPGAANYLTTLASVFVAIGVTLATYGKKKEAGK